MVSYSKSVLKALCQENERDHARPLAPIFSLKFPFSISRVRAFVKEAVSRSTEFILAIETASSTLLICYNRQTVSSGFR